MTLYSYSASLHPGVQMGTTEFNAGGNPPMDWHPIQGGLEIVLVASCHRNQDKLWPGGSPGSYADFHLLYLMHYAVPGNIYTPPTEESGISRGWGGGVSTTKTFKEMHQA